MFQEKSQFQARSGRTIKVGEDGTLIFDHVHGYLDPDSAMDAEEWAQAKHDADLGRWRWPENPTFVVYVIGRSGDVVNVMNEQNGMSAQFSRNEMTFFGLPIETDDPNYSGAAHAYFEAHPTPKSPTADEILAGLRATCTELSMQAVDLIESLRRGR